MKVVIPVKLIEGTAFVDSAFARASAFWVFDTESQSATVEENRAASRPGGAGTVAAQQVLDTGATALLTPQLGENAARVLRKGGFVLYSSQPGSALENLRAFQEGALSPLTETHSGYHGAPGS